MKRAKKCETIYEWRRFGDGGNSWEMNFPANSSLVRLEWKSSQFSSTKASQIVFTYTNSTRLDKSLRVLVNHVENCQFLLFSYLEIFVALDIGVGDVVMPRLDIFICGVSYHGAAWAEMLTEAWMSFVFVSSHHLFRSAPSCVLNFHGIMPLFVWMSIRIHDENKFEVLCCKDTNSAVPPMNY